MIVANTEKDTDMGKRKPPTAPAIEPPKATAADVAAQAHAAKQLYAQAGENMRESLNSLRSVFEATEALVLASADDCDRQGDIVAETVRLAAERANDLANRTRQTRDDLGVELPALRVPPRKVTPAAPAASTAEEVARQPETPTAEPAAAAAETPSTPGE